MEAPPRFELGVEILQTSALPLGYGAIWNCLKKSIHETAIWFACRLMNGAGNGARTRHLSLGKAALYQMSYSRRKTGASEWT